MSKKVKKWDFLENIKIEKVWYGWVGIASLDDKKKIIIKWTVIPYSTVKIRVTKTKKDYIEWILVQITDYDGELLAPPCGYYPSCGGCKWQNINYETQLDIKMKIITDSFRLYPDILNQTQIYDIIWTSETYKYRNKIEFSFGKFISNINKVSDEERHSEAYIRQTEKEMEEINIKKLDSIEDTDDIEDQSLKVVNEQWNCGFHKQWFFSKVMDVAECKLISDKANRVYAEVRKICKWSTLPVYDQKTHEWFFRHLVIREWFNTGQMLINMVVCAKYIDTEEKKLKFENLKKTLMGNEFIQGQINSFVISYNNGLADIVRAQDTEFEILRWDWFIFEYLEFAKFNAVQKTKKSAEIYVEDGKIIEKKIWFESSNVSSQVAKNIVKFRVSPFAFFQTNTKWAEILFQKAMNIVWDVRWTVLDLYCGAGTIGISFMKQGIWNFLIWVEIVPEAIQDAIYNVELNNLKSNSYFVAGKAENLVHNDETIKHKLQDLDLIIVDPPRDGMHKSVIKFLNDIKAKHNCKLLYISCGPVSMARDIDLLIQWWRKFQYLQPVDMFAQTHHVENIWLLV